MVLIMLMRHVVQVRCRLAKGATDKSHRMTTARLRKRAKALVVGDGVNSQRRIGFPTCCTVIPTPDMRVGEACRDCVKNPIQLPARPARGPIRRGRRTALAQFHRTAIHHRGIKTNEITLPNFVDSPSIRAARTKARKLSNDELPQHSASLVAYEQGEHSLVSVVASAYAPWKFYATLSTQPSTAGRARELTQTTPSLVVASMCKPWCQDCNSHAPPAYPNLSCGTGS